MNEQPPIPPEKPIADVLAECGGVPEIAMRHKLPIVLHVYNGTDGPIYALEATSGEDTWEIGQIWDFGNDAKDTADAIVLAINHLPRLIREIRELQADSHELVSFKNGYDDLKADRDSLRAQLETDDALPRQLLDVHAICDQRDKAVAECDSLRAKLDAINEAIGEIGAEADYGIAVERLAGNVVKAEFYKGQRSVLSQIGAILDAAIAKEGK